MRKFYTKLLVSVFILMCADTRAQVSTYLFSQSTGTYTPISGGTLIGKSTATTGASSLDDVNFNQPAGTIPFAFTFNGISYTGFNINTNGQITFGSTLPGTTNYSPISSTTAYSGAAAAFANDLRGIFQTTATRTSGSNTLTNVTNVTGISIGDVVTATTGIPAGTTVTAITPTTITISAAATSSATGATFSFGTGEIRITTSGVAPNRIFIIQFSNFQAFGVNNSSLNFQVQLNEGGGNPLNQTINTVYGPILQNTSTTGQVGLRGATNTDFNNRTSTTSWTASTAGATNTATMTLSSTVFPSSGTIYTWTPSAAPPIDLALVSVTATAANPCPTNSQPVSSVIKNTGSNTIDFSTNNASVTVNITGSNPQTLTTTLVTGTLAPNATMTVPLAPNANLSNGGSNTLNGTVSITGDGLAINNTASTTILLASQATLPLSVNFTGFTGSNLSTAFPGWSEGAGATTPSGTTSAWTSTTDLGSTGNVTAKINLFTTTRNEWIVSPRFLAGSNTLLQYDVAVTDFASVTDPAVMGSDDRVSVMVSTDCGVTWTEVKAYTVADNLSMTLTTQLVDLSSYNGQNIMVAFKATDGPVNDPEDYDFHIDNILIGSSCTGTPLGGTANSSASSACYGSPLTLSLTGATTGIGITYTWQYAPILSSTWTDIPGSAGSSYVIIPLGSYQYRAKVTCVGSGLSDFSSTIAVSISGIPTYASMPFTEDFEAWSDGCSTTDRPGVNWGSSPPTGNNSWRRDDQGTSAAWTSNNGSFTPAFTSGAHSARFHSYNASDGTSGSLDLFIDLSSSTGTKFLKFDYINTSGSDVLKVLVSTDGGFSFTQAGATLGTQSAWSTKEFSINSNSATTVIRLMATSDFGATDIGVDNLSVILACSGAPVAGSAVATPSSVCYGSSTVLSLSGSTTGVGGITYQWQGSPDGTVWTDIPSAVGASYSINSSTAPYQYRAIVSCTAGSSNISAPVTVSIVNVPVYAPLPYVQNFESWIDGCSTSDRPDGNWANIPVTGNNSWRRDDQGGTAGWSNNNGLYSPAFSTGAHSARFNTWNAPSGTSGTLDLFIDLSSSTDDKLLKFDYINPVGTDSLTIFFSTDGGSTFVRLDSLKNRTAWSTKQIIISSNSPTAVIRFRAISDFGGGAADIGIDNVQVLVGCTGAPVSGSINVSGSLPVCINNSVTLNLSGQTTAAGIALQWQSSTDNVTFSDISGASGISFVASPTVNTYYRVAVNCTNTSQVTYSASQLVNVNSPAITSTTPATRCGIGSVGLSASGSAGSSVKWYSAATGGSPLATGTLFTTPELSANTTYYVGAETGTAPVGSGNATSTSYESPFYHLYGGKKSQYLILASELTASGLTAGNISTIGFNVVAAGTTYNNFSISMKNTTNAVMTTTLQTGLTTVYTAPAVTPVVGVNMYSFSTPFAWDGTSNVVVDICWSNNNTGGSGATVKMNSTSFVSHAYYRADNQDVATICGATTATATSSLRPQFILDPAYCAGNRTAVAATVTTPPAISVLPAAVGICSGQSATLIVNSSNSGYTYSWTGGQTGSPVSVSPTTTTKYIVTATDNSGGANNGCVNRDSITVTVNSLPPVLTITPSASAVCPGGIVTLNTSAGAASGTAVVSGTAVTSSTAAQSPFYRLFEGSRKQYLVRASELTALGLVSGSTLTSLSLNVAAVNGTPNNMNNLRVKIGATSVNTMTSFLTDPVTVVYNSPSLSPAAGANVLNFTSTFTWNGTSNIFVEVCFDNDADATCTAGSPTCWGNTPDVTVATAPFTSTVYYYADNSTGVRDMCSIATVTGTSPIRPVMTFAYNNPIVTWTPVTGLYTDAAATTAYVAGNYAATLYAKPGATTTYTATSSTVFSCSTVSTVTVTINTPPAITLQPVNSIGCTGGNVTFNVSATGTGLSYQWRKNGTAIGTNASSLTLTNLSASDVATYDVVISGTCPSPVTSNAVTLVVGDNSWVGTSNSDWNNPLNWCGGVPTATTNVLIPSGTPFSPSINGNSNANNIIINSGATVTIGAGGRLMLYGNLTNNGTFNSAAGSIEFRGTTNQSVPAITAAHIIMNGAGGITLGGTMNIGSSLTLTNGNITLGTNNLVMTGGSTGSIGSHIVTNGSGKVTNNNIGVATVIFPVGPSATTYNPVMIANGQGRNYTAGVATGITPAIANSARAVNRTWNITSNTAPATPVNISLQYADADANGTPTANMEVGVHNGTSWVTVSPAGGIAPTGSATARLVAYQTTSFGPTVLSNTGGINFPTAVSNVDPDVTSIMLMPNVVNDNTMLRVFVRRTMKIEWRIIDANGRTVMEFSKQAIAGQNDLQLRLGKLASGAYILTGATEKGKTSTVRFIRM